MIHLPPVPGRGRRLQRAARIATAGAARTLRDAADSDEIRQPAGKWERSVTGGAGRGEPDDAQVPRERAVLET
jgi:hypothetical protein